MVKGYLVKFHNCDEGNRIHLDGFYKTENLANERIVELKKKHEREDKHYKYSYCCVTVTFETDDMED